MSDHWFHMDPVGAEQDPLGSYAEAQRDDAVQAQQLHEERQSIALDALQVCKDHGVPKATTDALAIELGLSKAWQRYQK